MARKREPANNTHLIADNEDTNRFVLKKLLEKNKQQVTEVRDGKHVIERIKLGENYNTIWLDLGLTQLDGVTCAGLLRTQYNYTGNIIAITAHVDDLTLETCKKAGFTRVISKPITEKTIIDSIRGDQIGFYETGCCVPCCSALLK